MQTGRSSWHALNPKSTQGEDEREEEKHGGGGGRRRCLDHWSKLLIYLFIYLFISPR